MLLHQSNSTLNHLFVNKPLWLCSILQHPAPPPHFLLLKMPAVFWSPQLGHQKCLSKGREVSKLVVSLDLAKVLTPCPLVSGDLYANVGETSSLRHGSR